MHFQNFDVDSRIMYWDNACKSRINFGLTYPYLTYLSCFGLQIILFSVLLVIVFFTIFVTLGIIITTFTIIVVLI